jgi:hypothetical protein
MSHIRRINVEVYAGSAAKVGYFGMRKLFKEKMACPRDPVWVQLSDQSDVQLYLVTNQTNPTISRSFGSNTNGSQLGRLERKIVYHIDTRADNPFDIAGFERGARSEEDFQIPPPNIMHSLFDERKAAARKTKGSHATLPRPPAGEASGKAKASANTVKASSERPDKKAKETHATPKAPKEAPGNKESAAKIPAITEVLTATANTTEPEVSAGSKNVSGEKPAAAHPTKSKAAKQKQAQAVTVGASIDMKESKEPDVTTAAKSSKKDKLKSARPVSKKEIKEVEEWLKVEASMEAAATAAALPPMETPKADAGRKESDCKLPASTAISTKSVMTPAAADETQSRMESSESPSGAQQQERTASSTATSKAAKRKQTPAAITVGIPINKEETDTITTSAGKSPNKSSKKAKTSSGHTVSRKEIKEVEEWLRTKDAADDKSSKSNKTSTLKYACDSNKKETSSTQSTDLPHSNDSEVFQMATQESLNGSSSTEATMAEPKTPAETPDRHAPQSCYYFPFCTKDPNICNGWKPDD